MADQSDETIRKLKLQLDQLSKSVGFLLNDREEILFKDYAMDYLDKKLQNPKLRENTKKNFKGQVTNHLIPGFGHLLLSKITNSEWLGWVARTRVKITSFFNARKHLTEILSAAKREGHLEDIPAFDNVDENKNVGQCLTDREVLRILKNCKSDYYRFFFWTLWKTGCRPGEVLQWEWSMITWKEPGHTWITVPARLSKTKRTREIPLNPALSQKLFRENEKSDGLLPASKFVFPDPCDFDRSLKSYSRTWNIACRAAGIKAVPYDLRRSFITRCMAEGKPAIFIAKLVDTSVSKIESVYTKKKIETMEDIVS